MSDEEPTVDHPSGTNRRWIAPLQFDGWRTDVLILLGLIGFVVILRPVLASNVVLGYDAIAERILLYMLIVAAFNLLLGYTGLLSFGHAAFLGTGMYAVAIVLSQTGGRWFFPAALVGLVFAGVSGYLMVRLIVEKGEIYFAMLTFAFLEIFWHLANANPLDLTGGSEGLARNVVPTWIDIYRGEMTVLIGGLEFDFFWLVAIVFVVSIYLLYRIVKSPFGRTLVAIRENDELARSVGIDVRRYKVHSFTLSAVFTSVAGVFLVVVEGGVSTENLHWMQSGEIILMTIIGGVTSFIGPMIGAVLWIGGADYLQSFEHLVLPFPGFEIVRYDVTDFTAYWRFLFGLLFVIIIIVRPNDGIWGSIKDTGNWICDQAAQRFGGGRR